jgi:hypothetical protein
MNPWQFFTSLQIARATGSTEAAIRANWPPLAEALEQQGVYDRLVSIAAIATIRVEAGAGFAPIREFASGDAYEGRIDLGNTEPGDGRRYVGRGLIQISGRANYRTYGAIIGVDLEANPDLALDPAISCRVFAAYFTRHYIRWIPAPAPLMNCADLARAEEWRGVRVAVNGGENGLDLFMHVVTTLEGATMPGPLPYNPDAPIDLQPVDWSCSIESAQWLLRSIGRNPDASNPRDDPWMRSQLVPGIVSPDVGLKKATGEDLAAWITREYGNDMGFVAQFSPVTFDDVAAGAGYNPTIMGGIAYGHWVGVRKLNADGTLSLANPAPGFKGISDRMNRTQFDMLGPFHAIWIDRLSTLTAEPPPVVVPPPKPDPLLAEIRAQLVALVAKIDAAGANKIP